MKKTILLIAALISYSSAFADYGYSYDNGLSGFGVFCLIVMIAYIVLSIIILVRWWRMTENVNQIRQHLTHKHKNTKLTYLVAIGEKEQAQKAAVTILVDILYPIYFDQFNAIKAETMNRAIGDLIPKIKRLGIELPDYVTSGEKFIDYINSITGNSVKYVSNIDDGTRILRQ